MFERRPEEEGMGPLEIGRRRYQKGDFKGALEGFTEAVHTSTEHLQLNALDSRAATFEKLGQLQYALRDAKDMIDLMPRLSKGYLRCGKVLQLKGEPIVALKIYERGLKKVRVGADKDRTNLQAMYNKVRESLSPASTRDPLQHLPLEMAEMVIKNLSMRDKVICLAVSKGWKRLLESSPKLWTTFDTTNVKKAISGKSFKIHLRRSHWTLDRAIISMKANIDRDKLTVMTKNCKKLREVKFVGSGLIGDSLVKALPHAKNMDTLFVGRGISITLSTVQTLLKNCKEFGQSLTNVTFLNMAGSPGGIIAGRWTASESLKSIHLQADKSSCLDIEGLCRATPNAESVILNDWKIMPVFIDLSSWAKVKHLDLSNTQLQRWPVLPLSLTHLILSDNTLLNIPADEPDPISLPLLETFACHSTFITPQYLKVIIQASIKEGNLKRLSIGGRDTDFHNSPVNEEFPPSDTVEELSVAAMILGDSRMVQIAALYPNLKRLDASATKITGVAVKEFVNSGIKWLKLNECQDVSTDAVNWARSKGVEVEYLFPSRSTGGRTQRFGDSTFGRGF